MSCTSWVSCLWITLLLSCCARAAAGAGGRRTAESSRASLGSLFRARCASRCLSLYNTRIVSSYRVGQVNGSLGWCQDHKQCAKCLEPCKASWELKDGSCRDLCEGSFPRKHGECVTSCEFLRSVLVEKQGECPAPERASGFAAACVESCEEDGECSAHKKCCSNGCGHTCQQPKNLFRGAPLKPRKELLFEESPPGVLEVRWSSRFNVSAEPVVYVLERRYNYGIQPSEDSATPWQVVAQTTEERASLPDTRPGRWYQFRVSAINVHGTRGPTTPSRHFCSTTDPAPPPVPRDLRVLNATFAPDGSVTALLGWTPPPDPDVPIHHYRVSWSWTANAGAEAETPPRVKRRKTAGGDSVSVELDGLREDRSYVVELQALAYWGQLPSRSAKATLNFITPSKPDPLPATDVPSVAKPPSDLMDVGTPFYQDGQLQVRVYWKRRDLSVGRFRVQWNPEVCSHNQTRTTEKMNTEENFATLPNLLFSCKYVVSVQPSLGVKGALAPRAQAETTSFYTPSCATLRAKSSKHIACPGDILGLSLPKSWARAENLTASFSVHQGNVTALFSWTVAAATPPAQVTGFQVTWTETSDSRKNGQTPNSLVSQSQILPPDHRLLLVSGLQPASLYRLEVQALTTSGEGPATLRTFQTPNTPRRVQPYRLRLKKHHAKAMVERH
ncbi:anosmin-1-like [Engraulis encrasicolus]|uniref:anosmin-1-like n=1 Tax=Engraulis encrasicolus TaxID=184585 RepID=UPI002FD606FC